MLIHPERFVETYVMRIERRFGKDHLWKKLDEAIESNNLSPAQRNRLAAALRGLMQKTNSYAVRLAVIERR
jgi:hypothetical protein